MSLRERLQALRGPPGPTCATARGDLAGRIRRLRAAVDPVADDAGLARRLGARVVAPGVLLQDEVLAPGVRHGRVPLRAPDLTAAVAAGFSDAGAGRWLFLDTETTGLSGGAGTVVFLVGTARFRDGRLHLRQYLATRFGAESTMLHALAADQDGDETLVSYNGKSFDLPLLATRWRLHGLPDPFSGRPHLDLLHPVRRRFGKDWDNCRLATLEQRLLGFSRTRDLPGAAAPAAWLGYVCEGRGGRLPGVLAHNRWDLLSLAAALRALVQPAGVSEAAVPAAVAAPRLGYERLRALRRALDGVGTRPPRG